MFLKVAVMASYCFKHCLSVGWMDSGSVAKNTKVRGFALLPMPRFAGIVSFWQHYFSFVLVEKLFSALPQ